MNYNETFNLQDIRLIIGRETDILSVLYDNPKEYANTYVHMNALQCLDLTIGQSLVNLLTHAIEMS